MASSEQQIRVKAMLIAPDADGTAHAVSVCPPTVENPLGYHRLIGGSVEPGETHREAVIREVREELDAAIRDLTYLDVVENIFTVDNRARARDRLRLHRPARPRATPRGRCAPRVRRHRAAGGVAAGG